MAAIVRVKRQINEDPADSLLFSCKRLKSCVDKSEDVSRVDPDVKGVFRFAGTVEEKNAVVTFHVRNAIKKEKLEREFKQHQPSVGYKSRITKKAAAKHGRFKVVSALRAVDLASLDQTQSNSESTSDKSSPSGVKSASDATTKDPKSKADTDKTGTEVAKGKSNSSEDSKLTGAESAKDSRIFCLYDIEQDHIDDESQKKIAQSQPQETITCNGVPMIREIVQPKPVIRSDLESAKYVYDIYYLNKADFDFRALENILAIEALKEEHVCERAEGSDGDDIYGEDEDSNDEGNWRNDYPDEDPHYYDPDTQDGFMGGDGYGEDYNMDYKMSELVGKRLNICGDDAEDLSSDDEDFVYFNEPLERASLRNTKSGYDSYKAKILRELKQDYGEEEQDCDDIDDVDELS